MKYLDKDGLIQYTETLKSTYLTPLTKIFSVNRELSSSFVGGGISGTGVNTTNSARARSVFFNLAASPVWLFYIEGTTYQIVNGFKYPQENNTTGAVRITHSGEMANNEIFMCELDPDNPWVRFSFKRVDGAEIPSSEYAAVKSAFKIMKLTDTTLTLHVPADAKTVGDRFTEIETTLSSFSDGTTFTPSVSSAGVISWTNDGGKTNPTSVDLVAAVINALPTAVGVSF